MPMGKCLAPRMLNRHITEILMTIILGDRSQRYYTDGDGTCGAAQDCESHVDQLFTSLKDIE